MRVRLHKTTSGLPAEQVATRILRVARTKLEGVTGEIMENEILPNEPICRLEATVSTG
jgi:hypothetical protein